MNEKKYEEVVKKLQEALAPKDGCEIAGLTRRCLEEIFPELRESEDDKIRKEIIYHIQHCDDTIDEQTEKRMVAWLEKQGTFYTKRDVDDAYIKGMAFAKDELEKQGEQKPTTIDVDKMVIEYSHTLGGDFGLPVPCPLSSYRQGINDAISALNLEKQGEQKPIIEMKSPEESLGVSSKEYKEIVDECLYSEQKPVDKIEPKFGIDWWIASDNVYNDFRVCKVISVDVSNGIYVVESIDGNKGFNYIEIFDNDYHEWTIQEAKDGDVLSNGKMIVIFKHFEDPSYRQRIVAYIGLDTGGDIQITDDTWTLGVNKAKPATKEQRDTLMKAMTDAGYTFDFGRKELKKLKFKVGDWVVNNDSGVIQHIKEIVNVNDETLYVFDEDSVLDINFQEQYHLWTIQDAKDGDVLACPLLKGYKDVEQIFIFKGINNRDYVDNCIEYYCRVFEGNFYENKNGYMGTTSTPLYPATKEQRELLFQKMHEAGYEFDFEKKELKKVEQKSAEESLSYGKTEIAEKLIALAECLEMDGECLFNELSGNDYGKLLRALARELTEIKPVEWSEEDEKMLNEIIDEIEANRSYAKSYDIPVYEGFLNWLKSLKQRIGWKPSKEQMQALKEACDKHWEPDGLDPLYTLYGQLKKLTE